MKFRRNDKYYNAGFQSGEMNTHRKDECHRHDPYYLDALKWAEPTALVFIGCKLFNGLKSIAIILCEATPLRSKIFVCMFHL
jgi:hypothetical protein